MAYYCCDCVTWINSDDANRYGEKWCDYDRKYRAAKQNIYDCRGFVWARRSIITKVCEILGIERPDLLVGFDKVKNNYLVPNNIDLLMDYNLVGPEVCEKLDNDPNKVKIASNLLNGFMIPAESYTRIGQYEKATEIYRTMVKSLAYMYGETKDDIKDKNRISQLLKIRR